MHHVYIIAITSALLSVSTAWAQEGSAEQASPCVAVPIFHCVQQLQGGDVIGHFGYDLQCPEGAPAEAEIFINIDDDNMFEPGQMDRGQPKVFLSGEHIDEFEVDFSMTEVEAGSAIQWTVLGQIATVDFSKIKDGFLDCSTLAQ